jgi:hypothetical protein
MPTARIGRRAAASAVSRQVAAQGVRGFAVQSTQLLYVPFWQLELKLVGWQRYRLRRADPRRHPHREESALPIEVSAAPAVADEPVQELVARDVSHSAAACDARDLGLIGIADRLPTLKLRPFDPDRLRLDELACAVVHPLAVARRGARLYHGARLAPAGAVELRQRLDILRAHAQLVYYPVYRVRYRSAGLTHWATVDGVRGRVLAGTRPLRLPDRTPAWLAAGAASGLCAGLHPALGLLALGAWTWARLRARQGPVSGASLSAWLSDELGGAPPGVAELAAGGLRATAPDSVLGAAAGAAGRAQGGTSECS